MRTLQSLDTQGVNTNRQDGLILEDPRSSEERDSPEPKACTPKLNNEQKNNPKATETRSYNKNRNPFDSSSQSGSLKEESTPFDETNPLNGSSLKPNAELTALQQQKMMYEKEIKEILENQKRLKAELEATKKKLEKKGKKQRKSPIKFFGHSNIDDSELEIKEDFDIIDDTSVAFDNDSLNSTDFFADRQRVKSFTSSICENSSETADLGKFQSDG